MRPFSASARVNIAVLTPGVSAEWRIPYPGVCSEQNEVVEKWQKERADSMAEKGKNKKEKS